MSYHGILGSERVKVVFFYMVVRLHLSTSAEESNISALQFFSSPGFNEAKAEAANLYPVEGQND